MNLSLLTNDSCHLKKSLHFSRCLRFFSLFTSCPAPSFQSSSPLLPSLTFQLRGFASTLIFAFGQPLIVASSPPFPSRMFWSWKSFLSLTSKALLPTSESPPKPPFSKPAILYFPPHRGNSSWSSCQFLKPTIHSVAWSLLAFLWSLLQCFCQLGRHLLIRSRLNHLTTTDFLSLESLG